MRADLPKEVLSQILKRADTETVAKARMTGRKLRAAMSTYEHRELWRARWDRLAYVVARLQALLLPADTVDIEPGDHWKISVNRQRITIDDDAVAGPRALARYAMQNELPITKKLNVYVSHGEFLGIGGVVVKHVIRKRQLLFGARGAVVPYASFEDAAAVVLTPEWRRTMGPLVVRPFHRQIGYDGRPRDTDLDAELAYVSELRHLAREVRDVATARVRTPPLRPSGRSPSRSPSASPRGFAPRIVGTPPPLALNTRKRAQS